MGRSRNSFSAMAKSSDSRKYFFAPRRITSSSSSSGCFTCFSPDQYRPRTVQRGPGVVSDPPPLSFNNMNGHSHELCPDHLLVMVNGIIGSSNDWKYASGQFKLRLGDKVRVHCSLCNPSTSTFDGVDVMGHRLAEEVRSIIKESPELKKISFLAHSLGGLVARYAIGQLHSGHNEGIIPLMNGNSEHDGPESIVSKVNGTIAGLEAVNFITIATPHMGSRGNKQLPFLFGISCLEKIATFTAHWFVGNTGKHLFLTDGNASQMPLLQRMVRDSSEGHFLSALKQFRQRVAYSNVCFDHMVGWRTSSLRREYELPEILNIPLDDKYPHIMRIEDLPVHDDSASQEICPAKDPIEEEIIMELRQVPWRIVDVSFHSSSQKLLAHSTIQVKKYWMHSDGTDVIAHIIDNFHV